MKRPAPSLECVAALARRALLAATALSCASRAPLRAQSASDPVAMRQPAIVPRAPAQPEAALAPLLEPPSVARAEVAALQDVHTFALRNELTVVHRRFTLGSTVHARLVIAGPGTSRSDATNLRAALRLAAALEEGATRRNPGPLFAQALDGLGVELHADASRRGLVLSMDCAARHAVAALRRMGELVSEPSLSGSSLSFEEWAGRRMSATSERVDPSASVRRALLLPLRGSAEPWSPREYDEAASTFRWSAQDTTSRWLARAALQGSRLTLVLAGDLSLEDARAALNERWPQVARGAGVREEPLQDVWPLAATTEVAAVAARAATDVAAAGWLLPPARDAARTVSTRAMAAALERCASEGMSVAYYDDPERPVLMVASASAAEPTTLRMLLRAPERWITGACFAAATEQVRASMIAQYATDHPARWADARAWAVLEEGSPRDETAVASALSALSAEALRAFATEALSSAPRAVGAGSSSVRDEALCSIEGVRAVRAEGEVRRCPVR